MVKILVEWSAGGRRKPEELREAKSSMVEKKLLKKSMKFPVDGSEGFWKIFRARRQPPRYI